MTLVKTVLDILLAVGRISYHGKGLCKCIKEVAVIGLKIYNTTNGSSGSHDIKENIDEF